MNRDAGLRMAKAGKSWRVRRLLARDFQPYENHSLPERQWRYRL